MSAATSEVPSETVQTPVDATQPASPAAGPGTVVGAAAETTKTPDAPVPHVPAKRVDESSKKPPSRLFGWDKGDLTITDEDQRERYRRPALSPSTAKAMDGCPARWAAEKALPEAVNPFGAAELGTSAHSVLEDLFDVDLVAPRDRTTERAMSILLAHSKVAWPGQDEQSFAKRGLWISAVHDAYKALWDIEDPTTIAVHSRELAVGGPGGPQVEVNDVPFVGFIDRIDYTPDGLRPVDYKSSAKKPVLRFGDDHGDQMRLYAEVIRILTDKMPAEAHLHYIRLGHSRSVPLKRADMRSVLNKFKKSWIALNRYIDNGAFPTKASPLCGWCPLVKACPTAAANGFVDRTGSARETADLGIPVLRTFEATDLSVMTEQRAKTAKVPSMDLDFGSTSEEPDHSAIPDFAAPPVVAEDTTGETTSQAPTDDLDPAPNSDFRVPAVLVADPAEGPDAEPVKTLGAPEPDSEPTPPQADHQDPATTGSAPAPAAHVQDTTRDRKDSPMTQYLTEDRPWEETSGGNLNPGSYAASAVWGVTTLAYDQIMAANVPLSKTTVDALAQTLAHITAEVQKMLTGVQSFQDASNKRVRGALYSYLRANPVPFGKDRATWDAWVGLGIRQVNAISQAALRLHEADLDGAPWAALSAEAADEFSGS